MLGRRSLLLGAAAVAVAPAAATALPARVIERLGLVPCDGRVLPICGYEELFEVLQPTCSWSYDTQSFRVPDARGRALPSDAIECEQWTVFPHIAARRGLSVPVGSITLVVVERLTVEQVLRSINAEAHELNRRHRQHVRGMLHG